MRGLLSLLSRVWIWSQSSWLLLKSMASDAPSAQSRHCMKETVKEIETKLEEIQGDGQKCMYNCSAFVVFVSAKQTSFVKSPKVWNLWATDHFVVGEPVAANAPKGAAKIYAGAGTKCLALP